MTTPLKAGFYAADITPSVDMYGGDTHRNYPKDNNILTPFSITAGYWQTEETAVAILGGDLICSDEAMIDEAAMILREKHKLRLDYLALGASHTHSSGPCINWHMPPEEVLKIEDLTPAARQKMADELGVAHPFYRELIVRRIVDSVYCAARRAEAVRLVMGKARVEDVSFNRRQRMQDGRTVTHAGIGNPETVADAGPVDREVIVLGALNQSNRLLGVIVNFGCHATHNSKGFSADYPYYMRETVKRLTDQQTVVVFLNGCCGDVTQLNSLSKEPYRFGDDWARIHGQRIGFAVVDALVRNQPDIFGTLKCAEATLMLDYRPFSAKRYQETVAALNAQAAGDEKTKPPRFARDIILLRHKQKIQPKIPCRIGAAQIGNTLILTNQMECFAAVGMEIKTRSPFEHTIVSEITNGHRGYLPTPDVFGPNGGGYECLLTGGNYLEKEAARKLTEATVTLAGRFQPEKIAVPPPVKIGKPFMDAKPSDD